MKIKPATNFNILRKSIETRMHSQKTLLNVFVSILLYLYPTIIDFKIYTTIHYKINGTIILLYLLFINNSFDLNYN